MILPLNLVGFFAFLGLISLSSALVYAVPQIAYYIKHKQFMLTHNEIKHQANSAEYEANLQALSLALQEKEKRATNSELLLEQTVAKLTDMLN